MNRDLGLYLHIPFCKSKCSYCDFYSLPHPDEVQISAYVDALSHQLRSWAPRAEEYTVSTVYIGGGTPSYIGGAAITMLLNTIRQWYSLAENAEITVEANPDTVTESFARQILSAGGNRISLGMQNHDDRLLARLGRIHTFSQVQDAVSVCRAAGFENLSLDLMYGLPDQTLDNWHSSLEAALSLQPEHLSCYGLKVEAGTPLSLHSALYTFPSEELQADMYRDTVSILQKNNFVQYEISNFARPGFASRHNMRYWKQQEYLGFGPGAHSDFGGHRFSWEKNLSSLLAGHPRIAEDDTPTAGDRFREYLMLSLRLSSGLSEHALASFDASGYSRALPFLRHCADAGYLTCSNGYWLPTTTGFLLSNQIISELWLYFEESHL